MNFLTDDDDRPQQYFCHCAVLGPLAPCDWCENQNNKSADDKPAENPVDAYNRAMKGIR